VPSMTSEADRRAAILNERRVQLFLRVGAVTVAGGRAEHALQRLAHVLSGGSRWNNLDSTVSVDFSRLTTELRKLVAAQPDSEIMGRIEELLDWAQRKKLWLRRNNIVHAAWSEPPSGALMGGRLFRDGTSATIIASYEDLDRLASNLSELTRRVYELLDELTPQFRPAEWVWPDDL
jgi:hypothetical protein